MKRVAKNMASHVPQADVVPVDMRTKLAHHRQFRPRQGPQLTGNNKGKQRTNGRLPNGQNGQFLHSGIFIDWMYCDRRGPENRGLSVRLCVCVCLSVRELLLDQLEYKRQIFTGHSDNIYG